MIAGKGTDVMCVYLWRHTWHRACVAPQGAHVTFACVYMQKERGTQGRLGRRLVYGETCCCHRAEGGGGRKIECIANPVLGGVVCAYSYMPHQLICAIAPPKRRGGIIERGPFIYPTVSSFVYAAAASVRRTTADVDRMRCRLRAYPSPQRSEQ